MAATLVWNPEMSTESQNQGVIGPKTGHVYVSTKNIKKKELNPKRSLPNIRGTQHLERTWLLLHPKQSVYGSFLEHLLPVALNLLFNFFSEGRLLTW